MGNVAFFINGIGSLKGGGGAERFFADFFDQYITTNSSKFKLYYYIDEQSVLNLNEVGKLKSKKNIVNFKIISNRFKSKVESLQLYYFIIMYNIKIIHIPLYNLSYLPILKSISKMPKLFRPKLAINIVNCYVAPALKNRQHPDHESIKSIYFPLFKDVYADGYFCWNKSFEEYVTENNVFTAAPKYISSITSRFSDTIKFFPEQKKKNQIVFASRLDEQKHPEWFVNAIIKLKNKFPELISNWQFIMCGNGPMRNDLIQLAKTNLVNDILEFKIEGEMQHILNYSKVYVSCQDYDNFPSLSMAEAMASGNAILARNVGQTHLFLKDTINGLYINPDNDEGLMIALYNLLNNEQAISEMGVKSLESIKNVHTYNNFVKQIENFWFSL